MSTNSAYYSMLDPYSQFERGDVYRIAPPEIDPGPRLRLAILGMGGVAQAKYVPALTQMRVRWTPIELVAFSTLHRRQGCKMQNITGAVFYQHVDELLSNEAPDAVLVTSSDESHAELSIAALDAGAHVLVEKPIATRLIDARAMCDAAVAAGRILVTVCNKRYSPPYLQASALIDSSRLPSPRLLHARFSLGYDYVNLLPAGTVHIFDLARRLMGDVRDVTALSADRVRPHRLGDAIENAVVSLSFASGAVGSIATSATATSTHPWELLEVFGDGPWLRVEDQRALTFYERDYEPGQRWDLVIPATTVSAEEWSGYVGLLEDYLRAIRGQPTGLQPDDGYRALELVAATYLSTSEHAPVTLPLDPARGDRALADARTSSGAR